MMPVKHSLMVVLSSLLLAGGYSFPSLRLLFQDGLAGDNVKTDSLLVATGQWEWKRAGEASRDPPPLPRRKRDVVFPTKSSNESVLETTALLLLDDETSQPFTGLTTELGENGTLHPGLAGDGSSAEATATPSPLRDVSTEVAVARLNTTVATAPLHGQMTTTSLSEDFTETEGAKNGSRPSSTRSSSMAISPSVAATVAISAGTSGPDSKPGVKTTGSTNSAARPPTANSQPIPTVQARPPSQEDSADPDRMLGQCLLAISLLALVAGVFIITTFVLITLLLRQKRAYKLRRRNHTEMVCISSLLAAEEAEASEGRAPQAKWVKSLAENRSETDMDNLTLNSFLPDH